MRKRRRPPSQRVPTATPATSSARAPFRRKAAGILTCAFGIRLLHLWQLRSAPFYPLTTPPPDSVGHAPLYALVVGAVRSVVGQDPAMVGIGVGVVQALIGSLACVLVALAARRLFSDGVGLVAGLLFAFNAPAIFASARFEPSVLVVLLVSVVLWLLAGRGEERSRTAWWLGTGLVLGCLLLTRVEMAAFTVAALVWLAAQRRIPGRRRLALAAMLTIGVASVTLPVAARDILVDDELDLAPVQVGADFYIGNNARADGVYAPSGDRSGSTSLVREDATSRAEQAIGRPLTTREVSRYWTRQTLNDIVAQPGVWVRLMARKLALFSNAIEVSDTESQYTHAEYSIPLRLAGYVTHVGVLAPLALLGVVAAGRRAGLSLVYVMCATYAGTVVLFYVSARARYPLLPVLVLLAAGGLAHGWRALRDRSASRLGRWLPAVVAVAVIGNWPLLSRDALRATTEVGYGAEFQERGQLDEAVRHYRRATQIEPTYAAAHSALGSALHAQGRVEDAARELREALRLVPDDPLAHYNLGNVLADRGDSEEAIRQYRRALESAPRSVETHNNLGIQLYTRGQFDEAGVHFLEAIRLAPDDSRGYNNLGNVFEAQADLTRAIPYYRRAVQVAPENGDARGSLGWALFSQGEEEEAIRQLQRALQTEPDAFTIHNRLGVALGSQGRFDEAIGHFRRAIDLQPDFAEARNNLAMALELRPD